MQENVVALERSQMKLKNRSYALHAEYKGPRHTLGMCFATATKVARPPLSVTLHVHCLSCCSVQCTTLIVSAFNGFLNQCIWNFVHKVVPRCVVSYGCSPITQVGYSRLCLIHPCYLVFQQEEWDWTCRSDCESSWCCNLPELQLSLTWHPGAQCVAAVYAGIARTYTSYYWCVVFWPVCACNCACQHALPYALHARPS